MRSRSPRRGRSRSRSFSRSRSYRFEFFAYRTFSSGISVLLWNLVESSILFFWIWNFLNFCFTVAADHGPLRREEDVMLITKKGGQEVLVMLVQMLRGLLLLLNQGSSARHLIEMYLEREVLLQVEAKWRLSKMGIIVIAQKRLAGAL